MSDIQSSTELCRAVLENAADAVLILMDERIVACNHQAEELFGCRRERIVGRTLYDFSPDSQPDARPSVEKASEKISIAHQRQKQVFEWRHVRCDGSQFDAEVALNQVEVEGQALLVSVVRDITERKRLEDAIHNIAAGISAATGQEFLNLLVQYVARALDAYCAYVGELVDEGRIRTSAIVMQGQLVENFEYELPGTPCENVVNRKLCVYPQGVKDEFPQDCMLQDMEAESYIGVPLFDSGQKPLGLLAAVRTSPITDASFAEYIMRIFAARTSGELERKRSLQELLEEKSLTDTIINSLPGIFYMIDTRGRIVWRNHLLSELTGGRYGIREEADPHQWILEEDHALFEQALREVVQAGCSTVDLRVKRLDGSIRTYHCLGSRVVIDRGIYIVGSGIDLTEMRAAQDALQESERKFRAIFENAPMGMFQSLPEGSFLKVNAALARMFGYDTPEQMVSEVTDIPQQLFVHPERRPEFLERVMSSNEFLHLENDYRRKDGSVLIANLYMGAQRHNGEFDFLTGFVEDITEKHQVEIEKRQFYRETILSVTDGRLLMCEHEQLDRCLERASLTSEIRAADGLAPVRAEVRDFLSTKGVKEEEIEPFVAGVGEATANALRHAEGGVVKMGSTDSVAWVAVSDQGNGIEHLTLPRAVLLKGYSTKHSLGIGYTVMLGVADRVLLATSKDGTTVILTKSLDAPSGIEPFALVPDLSEVCEHPAI